MNSFLHTSITIALALPIAVAAICMAKGTMGHSIMGINQDSIIYTAGLILTVSAFVIMIYTLKTQGPGVIAGSQLSMSILTLFHLVETMREHVPLGSPWGYQRG